MIQDTDGNDGADVAAAPITISAAREQFVDFLKPFQHVGVAAVVRRPSAGDEKPFSFSIFQPLEPALWGLILLSALVVRILASDRLCSDVSVWFYLK
jgi:Ligated ion channel L-glutamate- and glycine-binding site